MGEPDLDREREFADRLGGYQTQLFGYIYSLVRNLDDADDLFQQVSLVLWDKFDRYERGRNFLSWACGVARYEVLNFLRHRSRHRLYFSDTLALLLIEAHEDQDRGSVESRRQALGECLKKLNPKDGRLLDECYADATRITEVARNHGRSSQSIHNSLRRIRHSLFVCVKLSLPDEDL